MTQMNDRNIAFMTDEGQEVPPEKKTSSRSRGQGEVILAIEDEPMLRDFLQMILGDGGYKVILAADGTEGIRTYMERMNEIHLVLLDMGLPKMSGEEVLSRIVSSNPNVKVISVSGSIDPEVQASALQIGAALCTLGEQYNPLPSNRLMSTMRTSKPGYFSSSSMNS